MTPQERYQKARRIPPSEWDWLRDYPVELNNIRFYDGEIRIDTQHGGEILISPDDVDANTVEKLVIESFIDHYAPEVELVWKDKINEDGEPFGDCGPMTYYVEVLNGRDYVIWQFTMSGGLVTKGLAYPDGEITAIERAISAAKAAAGELIKSVLKPG